MTWILRSRIISDKTFQRPYLLEDCITCQQDERGDGRGEERVRGGEE